MSPFFFFYSRLYLSIMDIRSYSQPCPKFPAFLFFFAFTAVQTHALGLRRAVPGRKKSFDDLLKEHKAAKEAMLKAKAEEQAVAAGGLGLATNSLASTTPTLVTAVTSPAAVAAVSAIKLGHPDMSVHRDIKVAASALVSHAALQRSLKPTRPAVSSVFQK